MTIFENRMQSGVVADDPETSQFGYPLVFKGIAEPNAESVVIGCQPIGSCSIFHDRTTVNLVSPTEESCHHLVETHFRIQSL